MLLHEAEFYNVGPLIKRLMLCEDLSYSSSCGDILFYGYLTPPQVPIQECSGIATAEAANVNPNQIQDEDTVSQRSINSVSSASFLNGARPGQMIRVPENGARGGHSRNSSWDMRVSYNHPGPSRSAWSSHSRTTSLDMRHSRNSSADLNKFIRNDIAQVLSSHSSSGPNPQWHDPLRVQIIKAHHNWIAVSYAHFLTCYRLKDSVGWQLVFTSPHIESTIERIALNAKVSTSSGPGAVGGGEPTNNNTKMLAISYGSNIRLWAIAEDGTRTEVGTFTLNVRVEYLFFIGSQLVALSSSGKIGVWHAMTQHWQTQDLVPILSFDTAGSFLLLGCNNGSIYYIGECFKGRVLKLRGRDLLLIIL